MIGVWEVLALAAFALCYVSPIVINRINPRKRDADGDARIPLFNIKTRDRPLAIAMVVGITAALTRWWSGAALALGGDMAAADKARLVAGDATLAAGFAVVATYTILEGVYGIMVFYSYLYDKLKAERRAAWEDEAEKRGIEKGKAAGLAEGEAKGLEKGRAEGAAVIAEQKAVIAEQEAAMADKDAELAEMRASQAGRKNGSAGGSEDVAE